MPEGVVDVNERGSNVQTFKVCRSFAAIPLTGPIYY